MLSESRSEKPNNHKETGQKEKIKDDKKQSPPAKQEDEMGT